MEQEMIVDGGDVDVICRFDGKYFFLSNFYPAQVLWEGIMYPTSEHAFQATKTLDKKLRKFIRDQPEAKDAKRVGRAVHLRPGWEEMKNQVMYDIVFKKFATNPSLLDRLLKTDGRKLIEGNHWGDRYWGVDLYGNGENYLGQILMKVRSEIVQIYVGGKLQMKKVEVKVDGVKGPYEKKED